jgi:hypothetical protein
MIRSYASAFRSHHRSERNCLKDSWTVIHELTAAMTIPIATSSKREFSRNSSTSVRSEPDGGSVNRVRVAGLSGGGNSGRLAVARRPAMFAQVAPGPAPNGSRAGDAGEHLDRATVRPVTKPQPGAPWRRDIRHLAVRVALYAWSPSHQRRDVAGARALSAPTTATSRDSAVGAGRSRHSARSVSGLPLDGQGTARRSALAARAHRSRPTGR